MLSIENRFQINFLLPYFFRSESKNTKILSFGGKRRSDKEGEAGREVRIFTAISLPRINEGETHLARNWGTRPHSSGDNKDIARYKFNWYSRGRVCSNYQNDDAIRPGGRRSSARTMGSIFVKNSGESEHSPRRRGRVFEEYLEEGRGWPRELDRIP